MLILTRRVGESIVIGGNVVVTVVEAGRDHVRIGVEAPRSVDVHRQEVYLAITEENQVAGRGGADAYPRAGSPVSARSMPRRPRRD